MGLSAREWLTVGLFVLSLLIALMCWLLKRLLARVDNHDEAIYGKGGLFNLLGQYVKREVHDVANAELAAQMDKMRMEGLQREGRILEAIEREGDRASKQNEQIRSDVSKLHDRVDRMRDSGQRRQ
jgi:cell division protein FtsB